jgi:hypothetical protein
LDVFRQADGFESCGAVGVVLPPCDLSPSERQDRGADELDLGLRRSMPPG